MNHDYDSSGVRRPLDPPIVGSKVGPMGVRTEGGHDGGGLVEGTRTSTPCFYLFWFDDGGPEDQSTLWVLT